MRIKLGLNLFGKEALLYVLTITVGVLVASNLLNNSSFNTVAVRSVSYGLKDILLFAAVVVTILIIQRYQKISKWFYRLFLLLFVYAGSQIVGDAIFAFPFSLYFAVIVLALFMYWRSVLMHNLSLALAIAGAVSVIGLSLSPKLAIVVLVVLSFYDIIAVYKTKHMVAMAKGMLLSGAPFGFIVPIQWAGFLKNRSEAQVGMGEKFMLLGSGDVALPLLLIISVIPYSIWAGLIIGIFSLIGVFITHLLFINQDKREPMAALPPIATFSILGYLFVMFFNL